MNAAFSAASDAEAHAADRAGDTASPNPEKQP
jgi:hypothetical protein